MMVSDTLVPLEMLSFLINFCVRDAADSSCGILLASTSSLASIASLHVSSTVCGNKCTCVTVYECIVVVEGRMPVYGV